MIHSTHNCVCVQVDMAHIQALNSELFVAKSETNDKPRSSLRQPPGSDRRTIATSNTNVSVYVPCCNTYIVCTACNCGILLLFFFCL